MAFVVFSFADGATCENSVQHTQMDRSFTNRSWVLGIAFCSHLDCFSDVYFKYCRKQKIEYDPAFVFGVWLCFNCVQFTGSLETLQTVAKQMLHTLLGQCATGHGDFQICS